MDLDDDGTPDIYQNDFLCVNTVVGNAHIGVQSATNVASIVTLRSIHPDSISDTENKLEEMPLGLISFRLEVNNPGDTAEVNVYLSGVTEGAEQTLEQFLEIGKWYKYSSIDGWQDYTAHATFDVERKLVILQLEDGGYGDADGTPNGIIADPSGLAAPPTTSSPSRSGGGGGCFIAAATPNH